MQMRKMSAPILNMSSNTDSLSFVSQ